MVTVRLPQQIERRLDRLARQTGRTKTFYAREAILRHIEDFEDYFIAKSRLERAAESVSLESLEYEIRQRGR
jgi:RHH-type transcriptional regulator, rel operon repressor / antitoxin RelB